MVYRELENAPRGLRHCELLAEHDKEPWHYILLLENEPADRKDITWWGQPAVAHGDR
jgi:hypothetical protein